MVFHHIRFPTNVFFFWWQSDGETNSSWWISGGNHSHLLGEGLPPEKNTLFPTSYDKIAVVLPTWMVSRTFPRERCPRVTPLKHNGTPISHDRSAQNCNLRESPLRRKHDFIHVDKAHPERHLASCDCEAEVHWLWRTQRCNHARHKRTSLKRNPTTTKSTPFHSRKIASLHLFAV
jgi:hypothetical protein